jgi:transcription elongation factor GreA
MSKDSIPFTKEGYERLAAELQRLKSEERPRVIQDIAEARSHGDLSENAEYSAARERQGFIEGRIAELEDKLTRGRIVDPSEGEPGQVRFGAFVTLCDEETGDEKTYQIVGDIEADIRENRISLSSPLARALVGKRVDDLVEVHAPKGSVEYTITSVRY